MFGISAHVQQLNRSGQVANVPRTEAANVPRKATAGGPKLAFFGAFWADVMFDSQHMQSSAIVYIAGSWLLS